MKQYLLSGFDRAIRKDMSAEMNDEEGMFHLLAYELSAEALKHIVDLEVMATIIEETADALFNGDKTTLRSIFEETWA